MTVREFIKKLKGHNPDLNIYIAGYEGGINDAGDLKAIKVTRDQNEEWYYGKHEESRDETGEDGLLIS